MKHQNKIRQKTAGFGPSESSSDSDLSFIQSKGVQDFSSDHKMMIEGKGMRLGNSFTTKAILTGVLGFICVECFVLYSVQVLMRQLSYWALFFTFAMVAISLKCSMDEKIGCKTRWLRAHHFLFELLLPLNLLATIIYWTLLREPSVASCDGNQV